jgi:hypothetical protein
MRLKTLLPLAALALTATAHACTFPVFVWGTHVATAAGLLNPTLINAPSDCSPTVIGKRDAHASNPAVAILGDCAACYGHNADPDAVAKCIIAATAAAAA